MRWPSKRLPDEILDFSERIVADPKTGSYRFVGPTGKIEQPISIPRSVNELATAGRFYSRLKISYLRRQVRQVASDLFNRVKYPISERISIRRHEKMLEQIRKRPPVQAQIARR